MNESPNESRRALVSNHCPQLDFREKELLRLIDLLDRDGAFDAPAGELSIVFIGKRRISEIHERFMEDPSPTDVITFQGDAEVDLAGEICVCPEIASEYAEKHGKELSEELTLYLIHGYLHLCGFDDRDEQDKAEMRKAESQAMELLEQANALPSFSLQER